MERPYNWRGTPLLFLSFFMPYIPKKKLPFDKLLDAPLGSLPDAPKPRGIRDSLQEEWLAIQFVLDQGMLMSTQEIERAIERQCEIEAQMDELDS